MLHAFEGFALIGAIVLVGWLVGRFGGLPANAEEVLGRLVYTVRQVGSAGPVFEYREAMPVTGEHGIPSLGTVPSEAVERLKAYVDSGRLEQVVVAPDVEPAARPGRVPAAANS